MLYVYIKIVFILFFFFVLRTHTTKHSGWFPAVKPLNVLVICYAKYGAKIGKVKQWKFVL